jgi:hypothetical protein
MLLEMRHGVHELRSHDAGHRVHRFELLAAVPEFQRKHADATT